MTPPRTESPPALRTVLWFVAVSSAVLFTTVYILGILTHRGQRVENRLLGSANFSAQGREFLHLVTVPNLALALGALMLVALIRRRRRTAIQVLVIMGVANSITQLLKYHVLQRPDLMGTEAINTFPSGHTVAFASVAISAILVSPPPARAIVTALAAVVLGTATFQLLEFGLHRPSDIVGGVLVVTGISAGVQLALPDNAASRVPARLPRLHLPVVLALIAAATLGLVVAAVFGIAVLALRPEDPASRLLVLGEIGCVLAALAATAVAYAQGCIADLGKRAATIAVA